MINDWLNMFNEMIDNIIKGLEITLDNTFKELMSNNENKKDIDTDTMTL